MKMNLTFVIFRLYHTFAKSLKVLIKKIYLMFYTAMYMYCTHHE